MKLTTKKVQNSAMGNVAVTIFSILAIIGLMVILVVLNNRKVATVGIVQAKENIYVNTLITEEKIQEYQMSQVEFDNSMNKYLLWDKREDCLNKYAAVATKMNGYIFNGDWNETKPTKNAYFQNLEDTDLIVTLPYDYSIFGNLLTPGDKVKVNVCYRPSESTGEASLNAEAHEAYGVETDIVSKTIFEELEIIDMLNSSGNSVYDYYIDLLNMPLAQREATLRDKNFIKNVSPRSLVLSVNKEEEFNEYCLIKNIRGLTYEFGLYPRKDIKDGDIIGQFDDLVRQISASRTAADASEAVAKGGGK